MASSVPPPTIAGYTSFLLDQVGVPSALVVVSTNAIEMTFQGATEKVWRQLQAVSPFYYNLAVYNLATSLLFNYAQDPSPVIPAPPPADQDVGYFAWFRQQWGLLNFTAGVVQSTNDQGTGMSMLVPDFFSDLTLSDLQELKDPYGRAYLRIVQQMGTLWGLTP